jgi:hypothetical protein
LIPEWSSMLWNHADIKSWRVKKIPPKNMVALNAARISRRVTDNALQQCSNIIRMERSQADPTAHQMQHRLLPR